MTINRANLNALLSVNQSVCLSMYMPTIRKGPEVQQNAIRFKNLLTSANEALEAHEGDTDDVASQLKQLEPLIDDDNFWQHQADGLALFVTANEVRLHRSPVAVAEAVYLGEQFHLLPLLPALQGDGEFFVVAVSRNETRLFSATRDNIAQIDADLPDSLVDAVGSRNFKGFGMHSFNVKPRSQDSTVPHGHVESDDEAYLLRYFREIDQAVREVIDQPDTPLVFVGDESLFAHYREANEHDGLVGEQVRGNPDDLSADEIHQQAWKVVEPQFQQKLNDALARYGDGIGNGQTSEDLEELRQAAEQGQIDTLFIKRDELPEVALGSELDEEQLAKAEQLGRIAAMVLQNSGQVFLCKQGKLNTDAPAAALLRYVVAS